MPAIMRGRERMKRALSMLLMTAGLLAGCAEPAVPQAATAVSGVPGGAAMSQFASTPVAGLPDCQQYSATATLGGKPQPLTGEACRQPDGSWHIAEQPAGSTVVYQTVYWPPAGVVYDTCLESPYDSPCLYGFPFGFSLGLPVFIDIHHHFDRFVDGGAFHRFGPGGHLGPVERFAGGFHGQFHGGFSGGGFHRR